ncbi:MAG: N-acetylmuramoyl-L-alanine amidase [candidate division WOR-3 bacterium]
MNIRIISLIMIISGLLPAGRVQICLDPGHGLTSLGAKNPRYGQNGPYEKDFNLYIANVCKVDLELMGFTISVTRSLLVDDSVSLRRRVNMANGETPNPYTNDYDTADIFVSIHNNAPPESNPSRAIHGTETYFCDFEDSVLAYWVQNNVFYYISNYPHAKNRGIKPCSKFFNKVKCPACLVEGAFVTHDTFPNGQWFQLRDNWDGFKDKIAWGIDNGIIAYYTFGPMPILNIGWDVGKRSTITLIWRAMASVTGYNIYRRTPPSNNFNLIASNVSDTTYSDNSMFPGIQYSYYIKGVRSGGQLSVPSNIVTAQAPPFLSNSPIASGLNTGRKVTFNNSGICFLSFANLEDVWHSLSTDYGSSWKNAQNFDFGWQPAIATNTQEKVRIWYISTLGDIDSAAYEETLTYTINQSYREGNIWHDCSVYETHDSILSISFAIDPLDTGWVVFNTYDDNGNNKLKIGKFYTQTVPESLENVLTLDTYTGYGIGAIGVKVSDRSLHIVYEKNGAIMYLKRDNLGNWSTPFQVWVGKNPSLSVAGDLIHLIWERWYPIYTKIQTCYTNGKVWSRIQDITTNYDRGCFPYMEKGSIAVWQQRIEKQWEVYASQRDEFGGWTAPQNISQTSADSKYPQAAVYQTITQTRYVYLWTEGNASPYEVKILPVSSFRSNPIPLYAFDLGEKELSVFTEQRTGYLIYGSGFEKSVDYDTVCLKYRIAGLDPNKIYLLGLVFYQDEFNGVWKQRVLIDNSLIKTVDLPRRKLMIERFFIDSGLYSDGVVELAIDNQSFPKAVLSGFVVFEFSKENRQTSSLTESRRDMTNGFSIYTMPNPAKGNIQINYQLPVSGEIKLKIFSATGQIIRLISDQRPAGTYSFVWDGRDNQGRIVPNGVYFVRLESGDKVKSDKIILLH